MKIIITGWKHLEMKDTKSQTILKLENLWDSDEEAKASSNYNALSAIFSVVDANQFRLISIYKMAKKA